MTSVPTVGMVCTQNTFPLLSAAFCSCSWSRDVSGLSNTAHGIILGAACTYVCVAVSVCTTACVLCQGQSSKAVPHPEGTEGCGSYGLLAWGHLPQGSPSMSPCVFQGNDQVRFELSCYALCPSIKVRTQPTWGILL